MKSLRIQERGRMWPTPHQEQDQSKTSSYAVKSCRKWKGLQNEPEFLENNENN